MRFFLLVLLLFWGCAPKKLAPLDLPATQKNVFVTIRCHLQNPREIGIFIDTKKPILLRRPISQTLKALLKDLTLQKISMTIEILQFFVYVKGNKVFGYGKFRITMSKTRNVAVHTVVVKREGKLSSLHPQEDLERFTLALLKEAVKIIKERYALFAL
jgi:hypothetical protein